MEKNIDILKSIYQKREILLTKHKNSKIIEYRNKKIIFHKKLNKKKAKITLQNYLKKHNNSMKKL